MKKLLLFVFILLFSGVAIAQHFSKFTMICVNSDKNNLKYGVLFILTESYHKGIIAVDMEQVFGLDGKAISCTMAGHEEESENKIENKKEI